MKRKFILGLFIVATAISSCSDDFLDVSPVNSRNSNNAFLTARDIDLAVIGAYEALVNRRFESSLDNAVLGHGMFLANILFMSEGRSDNSYPSRPALDAQWSQRWASVPSFRMNSSNGLTSDTYFKCYQGIGACENVLANIDNVAMDSLTYNQYKGEVLFLKGLYYFHLVRNFGAVPITGSFISTPDVAIETARERVPVDQVYSQEIIPSLQEASLLLPRVGDLADDEIGRATKGAALAVLGKAELQRLNFQASVDALEELLGLNDYQLTANFADIFAGENANNANNNNESIFEAQTTGAPQAQGRLATWSTFYELAIPSPVLKSKFYAGDLRLDQTIGRVGSPSRDAFIKYPNFEQSVDFDGIFSGDNFIITRLADVYLMLAEAYNELGNTTKALQNLNRVHAHPRTGLSALASQDQNELRGLIARERQIELAWEGHRWYDLLRYEKINAGSVENALSELNNAITYDNIPYELPKDLLYPIPAIDVLLTGVEQNIGW